MLTTCPYLDCKKSFTLEDDSLREALCSSCGREFTVRASVVFEEIERQRKKRESASALSGGPPRKHGAEPFTALLEDVRSLWNVGSIFRTADGAGFGRLFLCGITGCPPRKEIAKTSLGAEQNLPWEFHSSALEVLAELKKQQVFILGLERTANSRPLQNLIADGLPRPLCLILGNEVTGIYRETLDQCDAVADLPMRGTKESLNVAVAFGVAAYMLTIG
jgi:tRNA G18 (ribose-2'-O)-methylase SpoU